MPTAAKKPCCICRRWFRPDPRVGWRQRACSQPECRAARRKKTQAAWRARNPDYLIAWRIQARSASEPLPEPLRFPPPLCRLPWDLVKDEFGAQGADLMGFMGTLILHDVKDQFQAQNIDSS
jgi:hypothetical protein